jgi:hypothetical protein
MENPCPTCEHCGRKHLAWPVEPLATSRIQIIFEIRHEASVDSEDLARRLSEVVHAASNGLSFDGDKLLHDVQMFAVAIIGHKVERLP